MTRISDKAPERDISSPTSLTLVACALLTTLLVGCSPQPAPSAVADQTPAAATSTKPAAPLTAKAVLDKLTAAGLPMTNGAVQDENTDPNNLLGRPSGYTSRASFDVPGASTDSDAHSIDRGGVIEVWTDTAGAKKRADYIAGLLQGNAALGSEYHYLNGPVLVRISGKVKPSAAKPFEVAVKGLAG